MCVCVCVCVCVWVCVSARSGMSRGSTKLLTQTFVPTVLCASVTDHKLTQSRSVQQLMLVQSGSSSWSNCNYWGAAVQQMKLLRVKNCNELFYPLTMTTVTDHLDSKQGGHTTTMAPWISGRCPFDVEYGPSKCCIRTLMWSSGTLTKTKRTLCIQLYGFLNVMMG